MIVHNVTDRRKGWIGPWEVDERPLEAGNLTPADEGRQVVYTDPNVPEPRRSELGVISSWNGWFVHVRFTTGDTAEACTPGNLRFALRDASGEFYSPPTAALLKGSAT